MNLIPLNLVFEDQISEFIMGQLVESENKFFKSHSYSEGGFGYIKNHIEGFNEAAKGCPFFVLTDLDAGACAPALIKEWFARPIHPNLIFRVAVKEIESWLLADIEGLSYYTGVSKANFHDDPEKIANPKEELFRIMRKSKKRDIREDILPKDIYARVGPNYNGRLIEFVKNHWNLKRASSRSQSLSKTVKNLKDFKVIWE